MPSTSARSAGLAALLLAAPAAAQQADWQELALRAQQNATINQAIANGMLAALQAEIVELKAQLAKAQQQPPPLAAAPSPKGEEK